MLQRKTLAQFFLQSQTQLGCHRPVLTLFKPETIIVSVISPIWIISPQGRDGGDDPLLVGGRGHADHPCQEDFEGAFRFMQYDLFNFMTCLVLDSTIQCYSGTLRNLKKVEQALELLNKVILMTLLIISLQFPAEHNLLLLQVVDFDEGGDEGPE